jgi:hypothetical protein
MSYSAASILNADYADGADYKMKTKKVPPVIRTIRVIPRFKMLVVMSQRVFSISLGPIPSFL